jgi:hypothetical protein
VYAGPQQIDYSASWVYVRAPSLATYTMGPWYNNAAKTQIFVNIPKNQGQLFRIPRTVPTSIPKTKTQINGLQIGGVRQPGFGFLVDGTVTRKVTYQGTTVISCTNSRKAKGYSLLPQIPTGSVQISQLPRKDGVPAVSGSGGVSPPHGWVASRPVVCES